MITIDPILDKDGMLIPAYAEQLQCLQQKISELKINTTQGMVRRNAIRQLYEYSRDLAVIAYQLYDEAGFTLEKQTEPKLTSEQIRNKVNIFFNVDIMDRSRKHEVVKARYAASFLSRMFTKEPLYIIARSIGITDHTTVIHGINTCRDLMDTDMEYRKQMRELIIYFNIQQ